ncbi:MAG: hypothetical protein JJ879_13310 [Sneathiella sp.]|nr:hypothetical protein [Sneathiella sp.]
MEISQDFILQLVFYTTIAFAIFMAVLTLIYFVTFRGHRYTGESLAAIIERTEIPKLATIILIIVAVTFLALLKIIEGEAVITILSGIAGYVLGGRNPARHDKDPTKPKAGSTSKNAAAG